MKREDFIQNEDVKSYVFNSAKYYASQLVRKGYYPFYELDDLEQEILALFYYQISKYDYDETKSSYRHWISIIMENIFIGLIRKVKIDRKYFSKISLNDFANSNNNFNEDSCSSEIIDFIQDNNSDTFEEYYKASQSEKLLKAIDNLPEDLKELCRLLREKNVTDIAKELKISRDTMCIRLEKYLRMPE